MQRTTNKASNRQIKNAEPRRVRRTGASPIRTALLFLALSQLIAIPSAQAVPNCFGEKATIVAGPNQEKIEGTKRRDVIVGNHLNNRIFGLGGNDLLCGGDDPNVGGKQGDDIHGGNGDDKIQGGPWKDHLVADNGSDLLLGLGERDRLSHGENGTTQHDGLDRFKGGLGRDQLFGGLDLDRLSGGRGPDELIPGPGDDLLFGGPGADGIRFEPSETHTGVFVDLDKGVAEAEGTDSLTNIERVNGTDSPDEIFGDENRNVINGYDGDDTIDAREGEDRVVGGGGTDSCLGAESTYECETTL